MARNSFGTWPSGKVSALGAGDREFESHCPDCLYNIYNIKEDNVKEEQNFVFPSFFKIHFKTRLNFLLQNNIKTLSLKYLDPK